MAVRALADRRTSTFATGAEVPLGLPVRTDLADETVAVGEVDRFALRDTQERDGSTRPDRQCYLLGLGVEGVPGVD